MTTPTPIVCPDCGHPAFRHFLWFFDNSGGCKTDGCECNKTAQQAVEKFVIADRAATRRATIAELLAETDMQAFVHDVVALAETHPALIRAMLSTENKLKEAREQAKETRRDALLEAAKAVCLRCSSELPGKSKLGERYVHLITGDFVVCKASPIHALLAQERERAQGEGGGQ